MTEYCLICQYTNVTCQVSDLSVDIVKKNILQDRHVIFHLPLPKLPVP